LPCHKKKKKKRKKEANAKITAQGMYPQLQSAHHVP